MLIRTQSKRRLINLNTISSIEIDTNDNSIYAKNRGIYYFLGEYSTEEKALKVLDMIEERTNEPIYINDIGGNEYAKYPAPSFHMPQDNEVELL